MEHLLNMRNNVDETFEVTFEDTIETHGRQRFVKESGWTALMVAARNGHADTICTLLARGGDPECETSSAETDFDSETALTMAAIKGHSSWFLPFVNAGADVNAVGGDGSTPLIMAAWNGHMLSVQTLLNLGASVSRCNKDGWTAAHYAARYGYSACIEALAKHGASLWDLSYDFLSTPLIIASIYCHPGCVKYILRYAPDAHLYAQAKSGATAIHYAAGEGSAECVRYLVHHGDNINKLTNQGNTPLDCLISLNPDLDAESKRESVTALEQMGAKRGSVLAHNTRGEASDTHKGRKRYFWM